MNTKSAGGKQEKLEQPTDLTMDNYDIVRFNAKKKPKNFKSNSAILCLIGKRVNKNLSWIFQLWTMCFNFVFRQCAASIYRNANACMQIIKKKRKLNGGQVVAKTYFPKNM